ncbi:(2Fe-2S)-binding protein [Variovorax sp. efr-133-TYG-130]|uniref:(2Fe-2S)-binding protein n=1 Tax=Variovorax sp. efr-133-TYG-130 TaxID=3040327 RepID=UPI00255344C0|nr:(2Fe-2S)-binding protein [Variovorax sp. efr-133-TYG-130]
MAISLKINGRTVRVDVPSDVRLLWVLREELKLTGTKFGCGAGMCGACTVHLDGERMFSCQVPISEVKGRAITTIEGLSAGKPHPLQVAWIEEQVPQCGYCQSGQIMSAAALLAKTPKPSRGEIVDHMSAHICRCGTYPQVVRAIERVIERGA